MADTFNYRIDHHGSLVRPAALVAARAAGDPQARAAAERGAVEEAVVFQQPSSAPPSSPTATSPARTSAAPSSTP